MAHPKDRDPGAPRGPAAEPTLVPPAAGTGIAPAGRHVLGGRYEVRGVLGRGGMGEVWLARDLKLQVEVALKALTPEKLGDEGAIERLRAEVRSARAVASPHVCRVYDLVEAEGVEYVSMEYVDGTTLRLVLDSRAPLGLSEAREIALQLLAGLGAIHEAGLVHRDVKPENVMLTRAGRVVLMDFGIAKAVASGGTVAGTPAYWAPEQAMGAPADPRADVFACGIVLAEMVAPSGVRGSEERQALWQGLREGPPKVPDTPWSEAISKAVARDPRERYPSAQALARALEEVAHRVTGIEEAQPYPGLASFTEAEAEYFFGREAEVEGAWKRLPGRHLLAVVGPSGAGKSSFLRAGLVPAKPEGWAHLVCTPGDAPFVALGQALVPEVSRDTHAMRQMLRFEDADVAVDLFRRWRSDHREALVIVDQFEELFTLNPSDVQERFATLLSRLVLEADVHVLLSIRDDFLMHCNRYEVLKPLFAELMPLDPPTGDALRRALVQPALKCGYKFEDEALVSEMLQVVEGERGALPLLAFAAASLWERRDREQGVLTRAAHDAIGGVAGALAQHAEASLERIGADKLPLVRELFRNLVTAEGTRAVRDMDELISVFPEDQRSDPGAVLKALIDARLLTTYEAHTTEPGQTAGRRVEVVHESLLTAWPRLVRWRTEDEGSAQLRDQLRQVAHLWEEKGKPDDLLWTGTSYQEYQVWRSRYPGGLSEVEERFARAMIARASHRRQVRRMAVGAAFVILLVVLGVVGASLRRSIRATRRAEAEAAQREAAQLLALGRLKVADSPKVALAYAIASIERADNEPARRFAVETLWQGPPALFLPYDNEWSIGWSPDGRWLALGRESELDLLGRDAKEVRKLSNLRESVIGFTSDGMRLVTTVVGGADFNVWTIPEARLEQTVGRPAQSNLWLVGGSVVTLTPDTNAPEGDQPAVVRRFSLDGKKQEVLGRWEPHRLSDFDIDPSGTSILSIQGGKVLQQRLEALSSPPRVLGTHEGKTNIRARPWRGRVVTGDSAGELRIWDVANARLERTLKGPADAQAFALDPMGRFVAVLEAGWAVSLVDLAAPRAAEPMPLRGGCADTVGLQFSAEGAWLAAACNGNAVLWSMAGPRSLVLTPRHRAGYATLAFTPDGDLVSITDDDGTFKRWFLSGASGESVRDLWSRPGSQAREVLEVEAGGRFAVTTGKFDGTVSVVPLDGSKGSTHALARAPRTTIWDLDARLDPSGRLVAVMVSSPGHPEVSAVRILDLGTSEERTLDTHAKDSDRCEQPGTDSEGWAMPVWLRDGRLVTDGDAGLRMWDLATGTSHLLRPCRKLPRSWALWLLGTPDSQHVLRLDWAPGVGETSSLSVSDLASGATRELTSHGNKLTSFALDPSGTTLVTGDRDGVVRVGPLTGEEPRLLFGHTGCIYGVAVSPDGRTIASGSADGAIRLWPMPDMTKPPLHTVPHDELLAKLKSLTNLRAVRDPASDTGWKIEIGPFPGWAKVPEWNP